MFLHARDRDISGQPDTTRADIGCPDAGPLLAVTATTTGWSATTATATIIATTVTGTTIVIGIAAGTATGVTATTVDATATTSADKLHNLESGKTAPPNRRGRFLGP